MKFLIVLLTVFTLASCGGRSSKPTPFEVSPNDEDTIIMQGCRDLKKEVLDWNLNHPNEAPKTADC